MVLPLVIPIVTASAGAIIGLLGYKTGDTVSKVKTYSFYGVIVFIFWWWFFKRR